MPTGKSSNTKPMNRERTLAWGKKNLEAMKRVASKSTTSPASKKTLEQAIVMQAQQNAKLEWMLGIQLVAGDGGPLAPPTPGGVPRTRTDFFS
jgi:hypothetical protein